MRRLFFLAILSFAACTTSQKGDALSESSPKEISLDALLAFESEEDFIKTFGDSNVTRETRYCPEGMCEYMATILYKDKPNEVEIKWTDSIGFRNIDHVQAYGKGSWKTSYGIGLGTTLKDLEKMNGQPFEFAGFGWDYGGIVTWKGGNLDTLSAMVVLDMPDGPPHAEYDSLQGDQMGIQSNARVPQEINPIVYSITLFKNKGGE